VFPESDVEHPAVRPRYSERTRVANSVVEKTPVIEPTRAQRIRAIWMVVAFTIIATPAQLLFKVGAARLKDHFSVINLLLDYQLIGGLALYGIAAALMILALRHGELSVLYPIISLSYVWVAISAVFFLHESMNVIKIVGIVTIIFGVAILGRAGSR
jgi:drug/metabolite transporter (DMT)-like permease